MSSAPPPDGRATSLVEGLARRYPEVFAGYENNADGSVLVYRVPDDGLDAFVTAHAEGLAVRLIDASFDRRRLKDLHDRVLSDGYTAGVFRTLSIPSDLAGVEVGVPDRATQVAVRLRWPHEPLLVVVRRVRLLRS